jgi:archaemetzincin
MTRSQQIRRTVPFRMPLLIWSIFLSTVVQGQNQQGQSNRSSQKQPASALTVYIQPLGVVKQENIDIIAGSVRSFYGCAVVVNSPAVLTDDLLAKSKTRYEAGKILKKFNSNNNLLIITEKDIAHHNTERNAPEWGIFGLGYRPGNTCVVSTFRLNRKNPTHSHELFNERLAKVCLHEIGHNLGLDHCTSGVSCLMNDARGLIKTVDEEKMILCSNCQKKL